MAEHSLTAGEKLKLAIQSSPGMLQSLDLMVRVLLVSRYLFVLLGLAFFLWEGAEVFWKNEDLTLAVIEVALISVLGPVLVWVSTGWALRLVRDASRAHRQIQHEIAGRKHAEEALRKSEKEPQRLAYESGVIAEIGRIIGSTLDIDQAYERFADQVRKLISFDGMTITAIDLD